jgi:heavy metal efflux system protein
VCFPSDAEYLVQTKPLLLKFLLQRKHDLARILAGRFRGGGVERFVHNAEQRIKQELKLPEDYIVEFGGAYKNLEQPRARLMVVVPAALALIFILIFLAFGSIRQALLVYTGIPLAATGGVLSLWLRGMPFSITAAIAIHGVKRCRRAQRLGHHQLFQSTSRTGPQGTRSRYRRLTDTASHGFGQYS